jgi:hypothetical protein
MASSYIGARSIGNRNHRSLWQARTDQIANPLGQEAADEGFAETPDAGIDQEMAG